MYISCESNWLLQGLRQLREAQQFTIFLVTINLFLTTVSTCMIFSFF